MTYQTELRGKRPRRSFTLTLDPDLAQQLDNFAASENFHAPTEAVRGLMRIALASTPEQGWVEMWRARAYNEVRLWALEFWHRAAEDARQMFLAAKGPPVTK